MSYPPRDPPSYGDSLHPSRHASKPSIDTNASGIADSTISFSAFPPPPSSIPSTPTTASAPPPWSSSRNVSGSPVRPLAPRRNTNVGGRPLPDPVSATSAASGTTLAGGSARPLPQTYSKAGWTDGASQISGISGVSVDAADDRLLPTSFITSLLQENKETRRAQRRNSTASDALSGISEMTYPPPEDTSRYRTFRAQPSRLGGSPVPPSSFAPIPETAHRTSSDSETLASVRGYPAGIPINGGPSLVDDPHTSYRKIPDDRSPRTAQTFPRSVSGHGHEKGGSYDEDDDDSIMQYKAALEPRIAPLTSSGPTHRRLHSRNQQYGNNSEARHSVQSFKSVAPSFMSRMSIPNSIKRFIYRRRDRKPLPPVPIIPDIPLAIEAQYRRQDEAAPLPELVNRAGQLHSMLEKEHNNHYHDGMGAYVSPPMSETTTTHTRQTYGTQHSSWQPLRRRDVVEAGGGTMAPSNVYLGGNYESYGSPDRKGSRVCACLPKITRRIWIMVGVALVLVLIVAIVVPVVVTKTKDQTPKCPSGLAGSLCDLNANCVCTGTSGTCNGLAQSIVDLVPVLTDKFSSNYTNADVYTSLWYAQGSTPGSKDCSEQAWLVDTGKSLSAQTYPDRARWTQAALLWNVVQSQDVEAASSMRKFVQKLPWSALGSDGPTDAEASTFTSTFAGYTYNFAKQAVSEPSTTFIDQGQPLNAQIARVGQKAQAALDRMYSYALASSTQREAALQNYWTTTLAQRAEDLTTFKGVLSRSPILLPFNGSSTVIRSLYNSSSLLFPPPLSCYPGFTPELMSLVQTFETTVFNLDSPTAASSFDAACFPDRPIYGILDLLRLRLPYQEDRPWLPRQAAVLKVDALPRAVVYVNEMMSTTFPGSTPRAKFNQSELDPRNYGTLNLPNHVILQYLSSIPVDTAKALAQFITGAVGKPAVPPDPTSPLLKKLSSIPPLEVAIFGNIGPTDVSGTVTSFMAADGRFFFGTDAGSALRDWSITTAGGFVAWAENSTSPRIVKDNSLTDTTIDQAWRAVASRLDDKTVGLSNLTISFEQTQKFSSS